MSKIDCDSKQEHRFLSVRRWQAGPEWRPPSHSHPYCEVIVVVHGTERAILTDNTFICEPGHVLFYPAGCVHQERQVGDSSLEILCLNFEWATIPQGMPNLCHDRQGRLQELTRWLLLESEASYTSKSSYQDIGVKMLTAEFCRLVESPSTDIVVIVHEYIQLHLDQSITLDDLAEFVQMNKFHFVRVFRGRTGMTPMRYVRQRRLDLAYRLILETNLPLREIAPRVGIANEYHLSRLINERYGRGSRELRRIQDGPAEAAPQSD